VDVNRANGYYFVDDKDILHAIYALGDSLVNTPMVDIDTEKLQSVVNAVPGVRRADVFKTIDGRVAVKVEQCQPLVRIINKDGTGFYLDHDGSSVPLSNRFTARVPVVLGDISEPKGLSVHALAANEELAQRSKLDEIYELMNFINQHELLKHQVDHIELDKYGEFTIIPRVGNHKIILGAINDLENKVEKLMTFYKQNISQRDLNKYTEIDLRYKRQVVCRKRNY
jgi:cell division protein FtsQ